MNELKKRLQSAQGKYRNHTEQIKEETKNHTMPKIAEPALVHPSNHSMVKIRDGGTIDIFVGIDNGIRIDPYYKTINMIGSIYKEHVDYVWSNVEKNATYNVSGDNTHNVGGDETHNIKNQWTIHAGGDARIISDSSVYIEGREKIHLKTPFLHLDTTHPPQGLDLVRPSHGLMYEGENDYREVKLPPYGYVAPYGIDPKQKEPLWKREDISYYDQPRMKLEGSHIQINGNKIY